MKFLSILTSFAGPLVTLLATSTVAADADVSLWSIVSPNIGHDAKAVLYVNGASLKSSVLLRRLKPTLFNLGEGAAKRIEQTCNIDFEASVENAVLVVTKEEEPDVYLETRGLDLNRITDCIKAIAAREQQQIAISKRGPIVEVAGRSDKLYFGWLNDKVLVTAGEMDKRERLRRAVTRAQRRFEKRPDVARALTRLDRTATAWGLFVDSRAKRNSGVPPLAFGTVNLALDQWTAEVHAQFGKSTEAASAAKSLDNELEHAKSDANKDAERDAKNDGANSARAKTGLVLSRLLDSVRIVSTANEVVGSIRGSQSDVADVIEAASDRW